jgi:HEAT repeat protein
MIGEDAVIQDLRAPIRSFRVFALEQAIAGGDSPRLHSELQKRLSEEDDEECRLLLKHAVELVEKRCRSNPVPIEVVSLETASGILAGGDTTRKLLLLAEISPETARSLSSRAPRWLHEERHPAVASRLIQVFSPFWPPEELSFLMNLVSSNMVSVRSACLEALIQRDPNLLLNVLPDFLVSPDPRMRALAVKGLGKIDPQEAVLHLEGMLFHEAPGMKLAGLQNCLLMPFALVKSLLLKVFAAEEDAALLKRVGLVLRINADPEIPYRLWEIAEDSGREKAQLSREILQGALKTVQQTHENEEAFRLYRDRLQQWINRRLGVRFAQEVVSAFSQDRGGAPEIPAILQDRRRLARPEIQRALEEALDWPISADVVRKISLLLQETGSSLPGNDSVTSEPSTKAFVELGIEDQCRRISGCPEEEKTAIQPILTEIFRNPSSPPELLAVSLKAATRFGLPEFLEISRPWMDSEVEALAANAVDYQGSLNPDALLPHLGRFLKSNKPRVKAAALRLIKRVDPAQALSTLGALLKQSRPEERQVALNCLIFFDFAVIRNLLTDFLLGEPGEDVVKGCLCLFLGNPDPENLYSLYCLEKKLPGLQGSLARETRLKCQTILAKFERLPPTFGLKELEDRWETEVTRRRNPPKYAFKGESGGACASFSPEKRKAVQQAVGFLLILLVLSALFHGIRGRCFPETPGKEVKLGGDSNAAESRRAALLKSLKSNPGIALHSGPGKPWEIVAPEGGAGGEDFR